MADTKITALTAITTVDPAVDVFPIVDVSDTTMAASGTTKKITSNQLLGAGGTATLASASITGDLTVDTSTLKVDSSNNIVGVGVVPSSGIGNLQIGGSANASLYVQQGTDTVRAGIRATGRTGILLDSSDATYTNRAWYFDNVGSSGSLVIGRQGLDAVTFSNGGNLGLGVTPSAGVIFQIPDGQIIGSKGNYISLTANGYYSSGNWRYVSSTSASKYDQDAGKHLWFNAASGTAGNAITFTQAMTLDASGRLLVGTPTSGTAAGDGVVKLGTYGHCISQTGTSIASGSSVDLAIITTGSGYQGFLSVANTVDASANVRTQTTYSVFGRGTSSTITQIATANGSSGGASFTVTTPSNGVIRITNTSAFTATISAQFFGGSSL